MWLRSSELGTRHDMRGQLSFIDLGGDDSTLRPTRNPRPLHLERHARVSASVACKHLARIGRNAGHNARDFVVFHRAKPWRGRLERPLSLPFAWFTLRTERARRT